MQEWVFARWCSRLCRDKDRTVVGTLSKLIELSAYWVHGTQETEVALVITLSDDCQGVGRETLLLLEWAGLGQSWLDVAQLLNVPGPGPECRNCVKR